MTNSESRRNLQTATPIERFLHWVFLRDSDLGVWVYQKQGITLLLVVVLLSAILSISIGIFNVVYGEFRISGEVADSFRALYAADEGIERTLYRDRQDNAICTVIQGVDCFVAVDVPVRSGGQYSVRVSKEGGVTAVVVAGQNREGANAARIVKRGFQVRY
ncbi:MAG: hypothetical protein A3J10_01430 [Candidatus Sungbacteria bacterium RIFCSPLOWO2_02_FULL_54_10]|uniref:Uncharacterized protein n=2 Tax=Candidatus Sungiibacteriota TaxID=1817917 RepID=A0A1G2L4Q3_9BACT|nr:MAG: hypothetical protein A3C92_02650 [Candidatus Sungbacteria bacterium RIFCSPHIGHO2_02_FULL_53_17]OHA06550.1 MAG: hypothetical protein A3B34_01385 [Candidatus Sungbacteria bacterium RIFCSPLOWO2_01_FULL_54_21]OHA13558.1 MAG: hypothetical protein A3J10_01430 [Candidatus Sungbacteria bacterium RIFCSPLOWO2_02_FULL_54_10]